MHAKHHCRPAPSFPLARPKTAQAVAWLSFGDRLSRMPLGTGDQKPEKSYLSSAVDSINPWSSSRIATPTQTPSPDSRKQAERAATTEQGATPGDRTPTALYGQSFRTYPGDCPPLKVQWFHAVDVPKRKPNLSKGPPKGNQEAKPPAQPKKFSAFSESDSRRVEARYQKLLEAAEDGHGSLASADRPTKRPKPEKSTSLGSSKGHGRVAVNEDYLFDVDIEERELAPVYWLGPIYEVRRGTWFFQEGSGLRPCEENLAAQLEEGYLKTKPWLAGHARSRFESKDTPEESTVVPPEATDTRRMSGADESKPTSSATEAPPIPQLPTHRLVGAYMNNLATYGDEKTAWMTTDGMLSWVAASVYERFAGGGYMSGVKLIRGYSESKKTKEKDDAKPASESQGASGLDERQQNMLERRSGSPTTRASANDSGHEQVIKKEVEQGEVKLQRQLSSLMEGGRRSAEQTEEEIRKREEQEIRDDYNAREGDYQGRGIEHLVLVTHGIGQRLGLRMDSVNFVHDVNTLRKTIKSVYSNSADLKALNSELGASLGNCRVQVLPVCWRHLIEFPRRRQRKGEQDLGDNATDEVDQYPSLEDITVEGVAFVRSLISDLALDVLLYQSAYREEISRVVVAETNRILKLFRERNPEFKGKIHLMGHSLGSAIYFDVLCRQRESRPLDDTRHPLRIWPSSHSRPEVKPKDEELEFDFDTQDFFCLGSPVGLFQMLKGRTIAARHPLHGLPSESPLQLEDADDMFSAATEGTGLDGMSSINGSSFSVSSPKVGQLFNIFHPSDPISYRMEPLISPAMASLKPQTLPYTKKGLFGNVAPQGLTGISAKVGQSVSDFWSRASAGIASNILNRSLGISNEEVSRLTAESHAAQASSGDKKTATGAEASVRSEQVDDEQQLDERKRRIAGDAARGRRASDDVNPVTLIDDELETLYSSFQKRGRGRDSSAERADKMLRFNDESRRARKMRMEEGKVRALNRNGRVDYSIQEGALDFNPINTIASHMSYWSDEDVNHFVLSQLLSGGRPVGQSEDWKNEPSRAKGRSD